MSFEKCGGPKRDGTPCTRPAGWGTKHPGTGHCKLHGGSSEGPPIKHGGRVSRNSLIKRPRIKELLDALENTTEDDLDLRPELKLLRALIIDYTERYDENTEALIDWHASFGPKFLTDYAQWQKSVEKWQEETEAWQAQWQAYRSQVEQTQSYYRQGWPAPPEVPELQLPPAPPEPRDYATKPRQVTDILEVGKFIDSISKIVERIDRQKQQGTITMVALDALLETLGIEMVRAAKETVASKDERNALYKEVEARWDGVRLPAGR